MHIPHIQTCSTHQSFPPPRPPPPNQHPTHPTHTHASFPSHPLAPATHPHPPPPLHTHRVTLTLLATVVTAMVVAQLLLQPVMRVLANNASHELYQLALVSFCLLCAMTTGYLVWWGCFVCCVLCVVCVLCGNARGVAFVCTCEMQINHINTHVPIQTTPTHPNTPQHTPKHTPKTHTHNTGPLHRAGCLYRGGHALHH